MLKGGLGVGDLIRAGKQAYLRAAIAYVTSAGSRVSASHLSVVTGLTRKEVTAILNEIKGFSAASRGEANDQRARRVLRGWKLDPRFLRQQRRTGGASPSRRSEIILGVSEDIWR